MNQFPSMAAFFEHFAQVLGGQVSNLRVYSTNEPSLRGMFSAGTTSTHCLLNRVAAWNPPTSSTFMKFGLGGVQHQIVACLIPAPSLASASTSPSEHQFSHENMVGGEVVSIEGHGTNSNYLLVMLPVTADGNVVTMKTKLVDVMTSFELESDIIDAAATALYDYILGDTASADGTAGINLAQTANAGASRAGLTRSLQHQEPGRIPATATA